MSNIPLTPDFSFAETLLVLLVILVIALLGYLVGSIIDPERTFYQNKSIDKSKIQRIDTIKGVDYDTLKIIWYRR